MSVFILIRNKIEMQSVTEMTRKIILFEKLRDVLESHGPLRNL